MFNGVFYGWWIVLASSIICMLGYGLGLYSFGVFFKPMMNEFGWTRAMTAGAYSLRSIQGGIFSPVLGWATDKYGPRIIIIFGALVLGLSFILMYFIKSLFGFYLVNGLLISLGMSAMLYLPTMTAISNWFVRKSSRALSVLAIGAGVGGFVCAPAAAFLIKYLGWRLSFVIVGIVIWVVVLPLSLVIKHRPEDMGLRPDGDPPEEEQKLEDNQVPGESMPGEPPGRDWTLKEALLSKSYWILTISFVLSGLAHSVINVHLVPALTDMGFSPEKAAFSLGLMVLISIVGRLSFGWLGDFFDKRYLFITTYLIQAVAIFILIAIQNMFLVYIFIVLYGIGFGGGIPLDPAIRVEYFGRAAFAKIGGFMAPMFMIAGIIGPLLAGHVFDVTGTYNIIFALIAVLQIVGAIVIVFARPTETPRGKEAVKTA
ncbi:MAG: MFS transporter [Deltaproteobacteria bacterium]|nr:MFS transporter [Deltaproteobacteria bacterium]